jgi:hypothetical protein
MIIHGRAGGRPERVADLYFGPMTKRFQLSIAVLFWPVVLLSAQTSRPPASGVAEPLALVNANVVNVRDGKINSNATIVLRGGRIESIGAAAAPSGVTTLDLKGKYVLPGLIDAHTHADSFAAFRRALESGVPR